MIRSMWYRGVQLHQLPARSPEGYERESGLWTGCGDRVRTWNDALAWIDLVACDDLARHYSNALPAHICTDCGERDLLCWEKGTLAKLQATGLCFGCLIWAERARDMRRQPWKYPIVNGTAYTIADQYKGDGFGGDRFTLLWPDGHVEDTRNLWHSGDVPAHWRERLPDTATFTEAKI